MGKYQLGLVGAIAVPAAGAGGGAGTAGGGGRSCARGGGGAWAGGGGADYGRAVCGSTPPARPARVAGVWGEVSSHYYATHALRADGTLWRWKDGSFDAPTPG